MDVITHNMLSNIQAANLVINHECNNILAQNFTDKRLFKIFCLQIVLDRVLIPSVLYNFAHYS